VDKNTLQQKNSLIAFYTQPVLAFWTSYVFRNNVEETTEERKKLDRYKLHNLCFSRDIFRVNAIKRMKQYELLAHGK